MNGNLIVKRKELIGKISARLKELRRKLNLKQDELATILGISKNTIVNVERKDEKYYSWPVVMSIVFLFTHTDVIKEVLNEESSIEIVSRCVFTIKTKRNILYNSSVLGLIASITGLTGGSAAALLSIFAKKRDQ